MGGVALATAVLARALTSQGQGGGAFQFVGEVLINVVIATVCYTTAGTFSWHWEVVATPTQWRLFNPATTLAAEMVGWSVVIALPIEFLRAVLGAPTLYAYAPAVPIIAIAARYTDVVRNLCRNHVIVTACLCPTRPHVPSAGLKRSSKITHERRPIRFRLALRACAPWGTAHVW